MKLSQKKLATPLGSYRVSVDITSHITGSFKNNKDETIILHRLNDEPITRKAKLRQDKHGEHYFLCCGERMYISDYTNPLPRSVGKIYRYH